MLKATPFVALAAVLVATGPSFARSDVGVEAAERICFDRLERFTRTAAVGDGGGPQPTQLNDQYRACVYAKSGQYPIHELIVRGLKVSLSSDG